MRKSIFGLMIICLVLCSNESHSQSPSEKPTEDTATIYIYRYKQVVASGVRPSVYCDDIELARMENGRYLAMKLAKGKHTFRSSDKQAGVEMELKGGETIYIRVELVRGILTWYGRLVLTQKEQGVYEIKNLMPLEEKKIKDKTKIVLTEKTADRP